MARLLELTEHEDAAPTVRDLVTAFGDRGFGALLLIPCLMLILPVGVIPGVPLAAAILMLLIAGQMATGTRRLWLPGRVARMALPAARLRPALARMRPFAAWLDRAMPRRFAWVAESRFASAAVAGVTAIAAIAVLAVGFVPGLQALIALPVLLFALGLVAGNGPVVLVGYVLCSVPIVAAWALL